MWFLVVQLHSSIQLSTLRLGIIGVRSWRRERTMLLSFTHCKTGAGGVPALSHIFSTEPGRCCCSAVGFSSPCGAACCPAWECPFFPMIIKSRQELNPFVLGQADVNVSDITQRTKILCWRAWRGASIWHKRVDNYVFHILTNKTRGRHGPSQHVVSQRYSSARKLCINWECISKYYV